MPESTIPTEEQLIREGWVKATREDADEWCRNGTKPGSRAKLVSGSGLWFKDNTNE